MESITVPGPVTASPHAKTPGRSVSDECVFVWIDPHLRLPDFPSDSPRMGKCANSLAQTVETSKPIPEVEAEAGLPEIEACARTVKVV